MKRASFYENVLLEGQLFDRGDSHQKDWARVSGATVRQDQIIHAASFTNASKIGILDQTIQYDLGQSRQLDFISS